MWFRLPRGGHSQAYARPQLIVLARGIESNDKTFYLIAHEAAHLWWLNATDTQSRHNFLNEAFAEYVSYLAIREIYGKQKFQKQIKQVRKEAQDLPSISRWTPQLNGQLMYRKGPHLLHQLHKRVGEEQFKKFLQILLTQETDTIEDMLLVLKNVTDEKTAIWFKGKL